ncbi:heme uptake protein IsdC [Paenibacillaceae bacterium]|nr:heme uptake protein IsdC [Paenibacillaceae bacterium]
MKKMPAPASLLGMVLIAVMVILFSAPEVLAAAKLDDGSYDVSFTVKKPDDDSVSIANDYFEKPARVVVSNGRASVHIRINHSSWITSLKVLSGGKAVEAQVVEDNKADDVKTVRFDTADLAVPTAAQMHVIIDDIGYDHEYTVRFVFDTDKATAIASDTKTADSESGNGKSDSKPSTDVKEPGGSKSTDSSQPGDTAKSDPAKAGTSKPSGSSEEKPSGAKPSGSASAESTSSSKPADAGKGAADTGKADKDKAGQAAADAKAVDQSESNEGGNRDAASSSGSGAIQNEAEPADAEAVEHDGAQASAATPGTGDIAEELGGQDNATEPDEPTNSADLATPDTRESLEGTDTDALNAQEAEGNSELAAAEAAVAAEQMDSPQESSKSGWIYSAIIIVLAGVAGGYLMRRKLFSKQ